MGKVVKFPSAHTLSGSVMLLGNFLQQFLSFQPWEELLATAVPYSTGKEQDLLPTPCAPQHREGFASHSLPEQCCCIHCISIALFSQAVHPGIGQALSQAPFLHVLPVPACSKVCSNVQGQSHGEPWCPFFHELGRKSRNLTQPTAPMLGKAC